MIAKLYFWMTKNYFAKWLHCNKNTTKEHPIVFPLYLLLLIYFISVLSLSTDLTAQTLKLFPGDLYIEQKVGEAGLHLWVANKKEIASILITDHTNDPEKQNHVYALRAISYNPYNGNEKRILNGNFLTNKLYSLLDSSPQSNPYFPQWAFHIFIPAIVRYGYSWTRNGTKKIQEGSWLNIRTFSKPFSDYSGSFEDNPFILSLSPIETVAIQKTAEPMSAQIITPTPSTFRQNHQAIASMMQKRNASTAKTQVPPAETVFALQSIDKKINELSVNSIDVALVLDTTISMRNNVKFLQTKLIPWVQKKILQFDQFRIGIVLYRDYGEEYLVKPFAFSDQLSEVQKVLNQITVRGGGDTQEAVFEGMYAALTALKWEANKRLMLQVGDAKAHTTPKGKVSEAMVLSKSREMLVQIERIQLRENQKKSKKLL